MSTAATAATLVSGTTFGAALFAAGLSPPSVITSQLRWAGEYRMLQAFLAATATSALCVAYLRYYWGGVARFSPRGFNTTRFSPPGIPWDGNLLGGALLGAGMAVAGTCPSTLLVQVGAGLRTGLYSLAGAVVGGILWSGVLQGALMAPEKNKKKEPPNTVKDATETSTSPRPPPSLALDEALGWQRRTTVVAFEALCAAVVLGTAKYSSSSRNSTGAGGIHPALGGLLIGAAQLLSILLRGKLVGVSTAYVELGEKAWALAGDRRFVGKPASWDTVVFGAGVVLGSFALRTAAIIPPTSFAGGDAEVTAARAFWGGIMLVTGSRLAGGCPSGHGISGMSLLSLSSFITMASAFAAGTAVALYLAP